MRAKLRRDQILKLLETIGILSVGELADRFALSVVTIRDILLLGGMVKNKSLALLGREKLTILGRYRANKAFLGSSSFTAKRGHCAPNLADAQIKEAIIRASKETYVLVDSSKYGHNSSLVLGVSATSL